MVNPDGFPLTPMFIKNNFYTYKELHNMYYAIDKRYSKVINHSKSINIFIDINSIVNSLYRIASFSEIDNELASLLINLGMHYRRAYGNCDVFFIHSLGVPSVYTNIYPEWKYNPLSDEQPMITEYINRNCEMIKTLVPYIPHLYYIDGNHESAILMCKEISQDKSKVSIIHSRNLYTFLIPALYSKLTFIYYKHSNYIYTISNRNVVPYYLKFTHRKYEDCNLPGHYLGLLMSMTSFSQRNTKGKYSITQAKKIILNKINGYELFHIQSAEELVYNLPMLYYQYSITTEDQQNRNYKVDLKDNETLSQINSTYFTKYPLQI